jgi:hypothetical protein
VLGSDGVQPADPAGSRPHRKRRSCAVEASRGHCCMRGPSHGAAETRRATDLGRKLAAREVLLGGRPGGGGAGGGEGGGVQGEGGLARGRRRRRGRGGDGDGRFCEEREAGGAVGHGRCLHVLPLPAAIRSGNAIPSSLLPPLDTMHHQIVDCDCSVNSIQFNSPASGN